MKKEEYRMSYRDITYVVVRHHNGFLTVISRRDGEDSVQTVMAVSHCVTDLDDAISVIGQDIYARMCKEIRDNG